ALHHAITDMRMDNIILHRQDRFLNRFMDQRDMTQVNHQTKMSVLLPHLFGITKRQWRGPDQASLIYIVIKYLKGYFHISFTPGITAYLIRRPDQRLVGLLLTRVLIVPA